MSRTSRFSEFTARLREFISLSTKDFRGMSGGNAHGRPVAATPTETDFHGLALELFALQFERNAPYRRFCEARQVSPLTLEDWTQIPAVSTAAFKQWELSCLPVEGRTAVFHSSGTTAQRPSRHFHNGESLALYEASLWPWFKSHVVPDCQAPGVNCQLAILTPPAAEARNSSLAHMFETVCRESGAAASACYGRVGDEGAWMLDLRSATEGLRRAAELRRPVVILGTAFLFVHLLDYLNEKGVRLELPPGSRVLETGGYKGRSRTLPRAELHSLITQRLGIPETHIVCEYGMSELSSQAYDQAAGEVEPARCFRFPPWARVQIVSPETGCEAREGETGLIRVFDLANVFSVMAVQTEDLGVRRCDGFALVGRAELAEARGCSLLAQ